LGSVVSSDAVLTVLPPPDPPAILVQPTNQTITAYGNADFSVVASGTPPFSYQWRKELVNIAGATNPVYSINLALTNDAGNYSVMVSNPYGSATSSNAVLTVLPVTCLPPPSGLAGWWRGEGNAFDEVGTNHGTQVGGVGYSTGTLGQAFNFNGSNYVVIP